MTLTSKKCLNSRQINALKEIKTRIISNYDITKIILYGSIVWGNYDSEESAVNLLILTTSKLSRRKRHGITNIIFEENLKNNTNFSGRVISYENWQKDSVPLLMDKELVEKKGILVYEDECN